MEMTDQISLADALIARSGLSAVLYTSVFGRQLEDLTARNLINPFALMEEVGKLERRSPSRTKKAETFKRGPRPASCISTSSTPGISPRTL
jgi:hypothetical protein